VLVILFSLHTVTALDTGAVTDGGEGVCVDPGEKVAILEVEGRPARRGKGWQLAPDSGGEETSQNGQRSRRRARHTFKRCLYSYTV
jgi:hypothetical protein